MTKEEVKQIVEDSNATFFDKMKALFVPAFKALMVTAGDGSQIDFSEVPDGSEVKVGDKASDSSLNGEVVMATGEIYVFENGTLTEIKPVEEAAPVDDIEALKAEIETLKSEKAQAVAKMETAKAEVISVNARFKSQMPKEQKDEKKEDAASSTRKLSEIRKK